MAGYVQRYRDMSDFRLAQLAADPGALVPEAREALRAEIARRPTPAARRSAQVEKPVSERDRLDGVAGWLAWYCLGLFGGAYNEIRMAFSLRGGDRNIMLAFSIFCLGIAAWDLATGISLARRARFTLWMIMIQLAAGGLQGAVILADGIAILISSRGATGVAVALTAEGLGICAGYAIWYRYFEVSKRVKITFGRNL